MVITETFFALNMIFKAKGFVCITVKSYQESLISLHQIPNIKLIVMDKMTSGIDGYEAIKGLKDNNQLKNIPIIITKKGMAGDKEKYYFAAADGYVSKPVNKDDLIIYTRKHLYNV